MLELGFTIVKKVENEESKDRAEETEENEKRTGDKPSRKKDNANPKNSKKVSVEEYRQRDRDKEIKDKEEETEKIERKREDDDSKRTIAELRASLEEFKETMRNIKEETQETVDELESLKVTVQDVRKNPLYIILSTSLKEKEKTLRETEKKKNALQKGYDTAIQKLRDFQKKREQEKEKEKKRRSEGADIRKFEWSEKEYVKAVEREKIELQKRLNLLEAQIRDKMVTKIEKNDVVERLFETEAERDELKRMEEIHIETINDLKQSGIEKTKENLKMRREIAIMKKEIENLKKIDQYKPNKTSDKEGTESNTTESKGSSRKRKERYGVEQEKETVKRRESDSNKRRKTDEDVEMSSQPNVLVDREESKNEKDQGKEKRSENTGKADKMEVDDLEEGERPETEMSAGSDNDNDARGRIKRNEDKENDYKDKSKKLSKENKKSWTPKSTVKTVEKNKNERSQRGQSKQIAQKDNFVLDPSAGIHFYGDNNGMAVSPGYVFPGWRVHKEFTEIVEENTNALRKVKDNSLDFFFTWVGDQNMKRIAKSPSYKKNKEQEIFCEEFKKLIDEISVKLKRRGVAVIVGPVMDHDTPKDNRKVAELVRANIETYVSADDRFIYLGLDKFQFYGCRNKYQKSMGLSDELHNNVAVATVISTLQEVVNNKWEDVYRKEELIDREKIQRMMKYNHEADMDIEFHMERLRPAFNDIAARHYNR